MIFDPINVLLEWKLLVSNLKNKGVKHDFLPISSNFWHLSTSKFQPFEQRNAITKWCEINNNYILTYFIALHFNTPREYITKHPVLSSYRYYSRSTAVDYFRHRNQIDYFSPLKVFWKRMIINQNCIANPVSGVLPHCQALLGAE